MIFRFDGNMRGGKTMSMTMMACFLSNIFEIPVYANYSLSSDWFPLARRFETWRDLRNVRDSIICFDEINTSLDSRNFKSKDQIEFTHVFQQQGKMGNTFRYSVQRLNSL